MIDDIYYWLMQQRCKIGWHKWIYWYASPGEFCVYCSKDRLDAANVARVSTRQWRGESNTQPGSCYYCGKHRSLHREGKLPECQQNVVQSGQEPCEHENKYSDTAGTYCPDCGKRWRPLF